MNVTLHGQRRHFRSVAFEAARNVIRLVDQRRLPHEFRVVSLSDFRATARAIGDMTVRGAPARRPVSSLWRSHASHCSLLAILTLANLG